MLILIPISIFVCTFIIYIISKIGIKRSNKIQITPPEDMNPLELAYIHNEKVSTSDVISLIPYLVDKKYIKMEFPFGMDKENISNFKIIKNKEYDGNNALERYILEGLFKKSDIVSYYDLCNDVEYQHLFDCCTNIVNSDRNYNLIFDKTYQKIRKILNICTIIGLCIYNYAFGVKAVIFYFIQVLLLSCISAIQGGNDTGISIQGGAVNLKRNNIVVKAIYIMVVLFFSGVFLIAEKDSTEITLLKIIFYLIGIFIFVLVYLLKTKIKRRNEYGENIYQKIVQFKDFLEVTPKESIEAQFNKNKDCYFDIFSYCFVLGMSDKCVSEYDKFFNNVYKILYEKSNTKNSKQQNSAETIEKLRKYNERIKQGYSNFTNMLETSYNKFLGEEIISKDIDIESDTEVKDVWSYAIKALKKFIIDN